MWQTPTTFGKAAATCYPSKKGTKCVPTSDSYLRWSQAARCSWCSDRRSRSSEVWEEIRWTGWCGATGGCAFPLEDIEEKKCKKGKGTKDESKIANIYNNQPQRYNHWQVTWITLISLLQCHVRLGNNCNASPRWQCRPSRTMCPATQQRLLRNGPRNET